MEPQLSVKTAARTLDVFEAFQAARRPLTLTELARALGAPISSCHALVRTLRLRGYLYSIDGDRRIYPTRRIADVARAILAADPILERIGPALLRLRDETGETVVLGKRQEDAVLYLEVVDGLHTVRYTARAGDTKPLHSSSLGKALLATLAPAGMVRFLAARPLAAITADTITDPARLLADIADGRTRGWFATRGENVSDVMAIAVPIAINDEPLSIAVAGPMARMEEHLATRVAALLRVAAGLT